MFPHLSGPLLLLWRLHGGPLPALRSGPTLTHFGFACYGRLASPSNGPLRTAARAADPRAEASRAQPGGARREARQPQSYVSKCEQGERRVDVVELLEIADALGVDPASLVEELRCG